MSRHRDQEEPDMLSIIFLLVFAMPIMMVVAAVAGIAGALGLAIERLLKR